MSLLTPVTNPTEADRVREAILSISRRGFAEMVQAQRDGIDMIWHGAAAGLHNLTPQQACDALGSDAVELFDFHGALTEFVVAQATLDGITADIKLPTFAFTRNQDGTITVDENTAYVP